MRNPTTDHATVAVIGGGPAGASAALTLARHGIPALLLEQSDGSGNPDGECLAPTANQLLHRLGLYDPLSSHGIASALDSGHRAALAITATLAGDATAFSAYTDRLLAGYAHYLWLRQPYYNDERRWPTQPFWARRRLGMEVVERNAVESVAAMTTPLALRTGRGVGVRANAGDRKVSPYR